MLFDEIFRRLAGEIAANNLNLLLVGGWALGAYGVSRQTIDIDFVVSEGELPRLSAAMERLGAAQVFRNSLFAKFRFGKSGGPDVDFLFLDDASMGIMQKESSKLRISDADFAVPSLRHLLGMKLHAVKNSRAMRGSKDMADIEALVHANNIDVGTQEFHELCRRYANEDILNEIKANQSLRR